MTVPKLPAEWERLLSEYLNLPAFYTELNSFLMPYAEIIPRQSLIFNVFNFMNPADVRCVLYGEDPYPRPASANGVAFWDAEIKDWSDKTNGNSLKNILKALLVYRGLAKYTSSIAECRQIARENGVRDPDDLFRFWLEQGVLLINTALTFSGKEDKKSHFIFWRPFHLALIRALNSRSVSPHYILWGHRARRWEPFIRDSVDRTSRIVVQGHPTFIHQFLRAEEPCYSPFKELDEKTGINWI